MKTLRLSPSMTELQFADGIRVLLSYDIPVAAYVPASVTDVGSARGRWLKSGRFISRSSAGHIASWVKRSGMDLVHVVEGEVIEALLEDR